MEVGIGPIGPRAALAATWTDLSAEAGAAMFLSWPWVGLWLDQYGERARLVTARHHGGVVALGLVVDGWGRRARLLPCRDRYLAAAPGDGLTAEHSGLLLAAAAPPGTVGACLAALARRRLVLGGVPESYDTAAAAAGLRTRVQAASPTFVVDLDALRRRGGTYVESLGASTRAHVRRSQRRLGASLRAASSRDEALDWLARMAELHQAYWRGRGRPGAFADPAFGRFHRALVAQAWPAATVSVLETDGRALGFLYQLAQHGHVANYQSGFDYRAAAGAHPGLLAHALEAERLLDTGARCYDLLAGEHRYKHNLAAPGPRLIWATAERPGPAWALEAALRRLRPRRPVPAAAAAAGDAAAAAGD